jgi:hypothetical protein
MNLKNLKFTLLISSFLILSQSIGQAEYPADFSRWQECRSSEDCTISKDPCENYVGVNRFNFQEYTSWSEKELWHCRALTVNDMSQDTRIVCLDSVCRVGKLTGIRTIRPEDVKTIDNVYKSRRKN